MKAIACVHVSLLSTAERDHGRHIVPALCAVSEAPTNPTTPQPAISGPVVSAKDGKKARSPRRKLSYFAVTTADENKIYLNHGCLVPI